MTKRSFLFLVVFLAGALVGAWVYSFYPEPRPRGPAIRANDGAVFTNRLLVCDSGTVNSTVFEGLREKIVSIISGARERGVASTIGFTFRDLNTGQGTDINDIERFTPGSLLKVPIMISYLREAERDPSILSKKYVYEGSDDQNKAEHFKPAKPILPGKEYSVEELLRAMIGESDNNAAAILAEHVNPATLDETYTMLQFSPPASKLAINFISPKSFSYFLRLLYNATYLSTEMSEKALSMMASGGFSWGIRAGVPGEVKVASKFGERQFSSASGLVSELHECGIVYYPHHPYLLCVMTRGANSDDLASVIRDISREVFNEASEMY